MMYGRHPKTALPFLKSRGAPTKKMRLIYLPVRCGRMNQAQMVVKSFCQL